MRASTTDVSPQHQRTRAQSLFAIVSCLETGGALTIWNLYPYPPYVHFLSSNRRFAPRDRFVAPTSSRNGPRRPALWTGLGRAAGTRLLRADGPVVARSLRHVRFGSALRGGRVHALRRVSHAARQPGCPHGLVSLARCAGGEGAPRRTRGPSTRCWPKLAHLCRLSGPPSRAPVVSTLRSACGLSEEEQPSCRLHRSVSMSRWRRWDGIASLCLSAVLLSPADETAPLRRILKPTYSI